MLPGGISQSFAYDNIGRLVDSKTRQSTKVRRERRYHWGKADRLLKTEDSRYGTTSYEYSPTGHLQKATYADGTEEYRLSDKMGNLFDDPDRKLRKYLQGGKIEQSGEWRFKYDKDGQLIEKYKGSGNGGTANETTGSMSGIRTAHSRRLSHPTESDLHSLPTMPSPASVVYLLGSVAKEKTEGTYARRLPYFRE